MEHVATFVYIQMQLQTVSCYTYMTCITVFKIKHKLCTASRTPP
jgi:hypothetical protein